MTTALAEKLSTLVQNQLPGFVREDYDTFVTFLRAYYEFLEQDEQAQNVLQNVRAYKDIDDTIDLFVDKFLNEFAYDLPGSIFRDQITGDALSNTDEYESKRAIAKRISEIYSTKGTEAAIRLLFRLLFDDEISFYYPKEDMLRASDGKWTVKKSLKVIPPANVSLTEFGGNLITGTTSGATGVVDQVFQLGAEYTGLDVWELQLDGATIDGTFLGNETVQFSVGNLTTGNSEVTGSATTLNVVNGFVINNPGYGYQGGESVLVSGNGESFSAAVGEVNDGGKIQSFTFTNFGSRYDTVANSIIARPTTVKNGAYELSSNVVTAILFDTSGNAINHGLTANDTINVTFTSNITGADGLYTVIKTPSTKKFRFYLANSSVITGNLSLNPIQANVTANIGALCTYDGEYSTKEGQLDEQIKLQDNYYYQDYSYVIQTTKQSTYWKEIVKKMLHPAGMELFAYVTLSTEETITPVSVLPVHDVLSVYVQFIKMLTETAKYVLPVYSASQIELNVYDRASHDTRWAVDMPTYGTVDRWKFVYDNMSIYDQANLTIETVNNGQEQPYIFAPPGEVKITGANLILNSTFDAGTNWTMGAGWAITSGNLVGTATTANALQSSTLFTANIYVASYEITSYTSGSIQTILQTDDYANVSASRNAKGKYTDYFLLNTVSASGNIVIKGSSFSGNIDNFYFKKLDAASSH